MAPLPQTHTDCLVTLGPVVEGERRRGRDTEGERERGWVGGGSVITKEIPLNFLHSRKSPLISIIMHCQRLHCK